MTTPKAEPPEKVTIAFNDVERRRHFEATRAKGMLASLSLTDRALVEKALRARPGLTLERLVYDGAIAAAREIVRKANSQAARSAGNAYGIADKRVAAALKRILADNAARRKDGRRLRLITSATLAAEAATAPRTAARWMAENAHLLPKEAE